MIVLWILNLFSRLLLPIIRDTGTIVIFYPMFCLDKAKSKDHKEDYSEH